MNKLARVFVLLSAIVTSGPALLAGGAVFLSAGAALAADTVFPPGSRIGLVPAEGLSVSQEFLGFESEDKKVKIGLAEIPPAAFTTVDTAVAEGKPTGPGPKPEALETTSGGKAYMTSETGKNGDVSLQLYSLILSGGDKFSAYVMMQSRSDAAKPLTDEAVRAMLATVKVRGEVPAEEQLSLLPFKITDLAGFKTVRTLAPRSSVLLTDGNEDTTLDGAPYVVIGIIAASPDKTDDRARFAEQAARAIPGLNSIRITSSEPMRIDGTPGFETRVDAVTGKNDTPVSVIQWMRFGTNSTLRIIASSTRDDWPKAFPRFRAVRDAIEAR